MSQSPSKRRNPIKVAIAALGVALVAMAALIVFLVWGRPAPSMTTSPSPTPTATTSATTTASAPPVTTAAPSTAPASTAPPPGPTPEPSIAASTSAPAASPSPTTTAPSPVPTTQTMMWEGKATFENFTVEVVRDDPGQEAAMIEGKAGLPVKVCLTGDLDGSGAALISASPWTLEDSDGNVQKPQEGGYEPAFPTSAEYAVGDCVSGFLTFDYVSAGSDANLVYENGLGDRAVWQFH